MLACALREGYQALAARFFSRVKGLILKRAQTCVTAGFLAVLCLLSSIYLQSVSEGCSRQCMAMFLLLCNLSCAEHRGTWQEPAAASECFLARQAPACCQRSILGVVTYSPLQSPEEQLHQPCDAGVYLLDNKANGYAAAASAPARRVSAVCAHGRRCAAATTRHRLAHAPLTTCWCC